MRLDAITAAQRRLLAELTGRISTWLAAACEKRIRPESLNVGVTLQERGTHGRLEIPHALLQEAESDRTARDALRVRIKAARDRMLFRPPPARPRADIAPLAIRRCGTAGTSGGGAGAGGAEQMIHVMLPVQYLRQPGQRLAEPEKRLALAVLQTVLYDYRVAAAEPAAGRARARHRQTYERAMAYVASRDRSWPYSFENLCETIGVDAGSLRRRIAQGPVSSA